MALSVDINEVPLSNVYGTFGNGPTLGQYATGGVAFSAVQQGGPATATLQRGSAGTTLLGHTLGWWAVFTAAVIALWALFQHVGPPEERRNFANIELSFVNVLLLSLVPLVGIPVWKAVVTTLPFPAGVKSFVNAA